MTENNNRSRFLDYVEEIRDLKKVCSISYRDAEGMMNVIRGRITSIEEVSGREIIETDAGFGIGIDQVAAVNDRQNPDYC